MTLWSDAQHVFIGYTASTTISIESKLRRCVRAPKNTSHTSRTHTVAVFGRGMSETRYVVKSTFLERPLAIGHQRYAATDCVQFCSRHFDFDFENAFLRFAIFYTEFAVHK